MSISTPRRFRSVALAVVALGLAAPGAAQAMPDLRGEHAKAQGESGQVGTTIDARGEFSKGGQSVKQTGFPWADNYRGGESKADFPGNTGPVPDAAPAIDPTDASDSLPYVVAGIVLVLGIGGLAIGVPLSRRVRVTH
jgi:hypothetical protein